MKIYILLLLSSTFILVGASEPVKVTVTAFCYDSRNVLSGNLSSFTTLWLPSFINGKVIA